MTNHSPPRTALITGGARGICRVAARILAEGGIRIAIVDREPADESVRLIEEVGGAAAFEVADVSDSDALQAALSRIDERVGRPDILLYGAGITNHIAPVVRMTLDGWQREVAVNLTGAFVTAQHVLPHMVEQRWGRIILISSVAARGGLQRQSAYAASKAGLLGFSQTVAVEHGKDGVTCNAILPGLIATEVVQAMPDGLADGIISRTPIGRTGHMEEVAHLIRFLAGEEAGFITGAEIAIDGGQSLNTITLASRRAAAAGH
jgi:NAD(P)-dependent dehydrogenase (short-subunit alcohol dehydrogenase family)